MPSRTRVPTLRTYSIQSVDPNADTLQVDNHGLSTGDQVQYNNNGHALIGGLVTTYVDNTLGDNVTLSRPYNVINIDQNDLALGTTFPADSVDPNREIITFKLAHDFQTGDAVTYHPEGGASVDGLTDGQTYYVVVLDDTRIKLVSSQNEALNGPQQYHFDPSDISGNQITVGGSGFTVGQALEYHAPQATTFPSGQVDFVPVYNGDGSINVAASNNPAANNIWFFDSDGNSVWSGFFDGDTIVYHVTQGDGISPGTPIGPLVDGGVYRVVTTLFSPSIQLKNNTVFNGNVDFVRSASGDEIIRLDGHNWADDGFGADQDVIVSGSAVNDGTYHIASVSGSVMTLVQMNTLTASEVTPTVTFGHTDVFDSSHTLIRTDYWVDSSTSWTANTTFTAGGSINVSGAGANNGTYTIDHFENSDTRMFLTSAVTDASGVTATFEQHFSATVDEPILNLVPAKNGPGALPDAPDRCGRDSGHDRRTLAQQAYFYRVTAIGSAGESIGSSEVSALVHDDSNPSRPAR